MSTRNLHYFFAPESVAVIGASTRPGSVGATVFRNLASGQFAGRLYAVNRKHDAIAGHRVYRTVAVLPEAPALAVLCIPASEVPGVIGELGKKGCRAAVVLSGGMEAEAAQGHTLRQAMLDAAKPYLLRILGPNCVGLLVPSMGLNASFAPVAALPGRLALISQSGAIATALLDWAVARRIGFSSFISLGDGSDVDVGDLLDQIADDEATEAILLYVESLSHARKFMSAARRASRGKPTLIVKAGRTAEAAHAAFSHTGALTGSDLVYDAALRRAGMLRVFSTEDLFDAAEILSGPQRLRGDRLAILTNGGGPGVLATDALVAGGGRLARLGADTLARLNQLLPVAWSQGNPVDIIGDAPPGRYAAVLETLLASRDADAILVIHAPTAVAASADIANALLPRMVAGELPVLTCWLGGNSVAAARALCLEARLPVFETPESAVRGFLQMAQYRRNQALLMQVPSTAAPALADRAGIQEQMAALARTEHASCGGAAALALLARAGIPVAPAVEVGTLDALGPAAARIGYPLALKLSSPDVVHKSDVGGVVLDIPDEAALMKAAAAMRQRLARCRPGARVGAYLLQAMARRPHATELIAGLSVDPLFGPVVLFGHGGTAVEVRADRAVALPPLNRILAEDLIARTRVAKLLAGFRDQRPADREALCEALIRIGQLAIDCPQLVELDINPLIADSQGVLALDARMRFQAVAPGAEAHARLAILPYPRQLERQCPWRGSLLTVRPIRPEDAPAHARFFAALTAQDAHLPMFAAGRALSPTQLARFTQIDYAREMAFIACRAAGGGSETLGVARVVSDPDNVCGEFALAVRSDLKRQGLGRLLMACLLDYCRARGLAEVRGRALPDNAAMRALAEALGFSCQRDSEGNSQFRLRLRAPAAQPPRPS